MKKLLLVTSLFSLFAHAEVPQDVIGAPGSAVSGPTLGGTTTYDGTSVTAANYHYGNAYMDARNQQMQGVATPVAPTVQTPPTPASTPKSTVQKVPPTPHVAVPTITGTTYRNQVNQLMSQSLAVVAPPTPHVATPTITGTTYRNHVNQLMSQSLAAVAPIAPTKQSTPDKVPAQVLQPAKPMKPGKVTTPTTVTTPNTIAPTINVNSSTLKPDTKIMTDKGIVTASMLKPGTQVAVPYNSAFTKSVRGGHNHSNGFDHIEHGTGNGANNAANSNSAHGLGGGSNIGGGRSGGGFHY